MMFCLCKIYYLIRLFCPLDGKKRVDIERSWRLMCRVYLYNIASYEAYEHRIESNGIEKNQETDDV